MVPLFEGRFKIFICGGGAAGRESSWIITAVWTNEPLELELDFLYRLHSVTLVKYKRHFSLV